jgi:putative ABC transport system ATP-binding protein
MTMANNACIVSAEALTKRYRRGREDIRALDQVSFEILAGEFVAVIGPSGAGKSTLLNLVGCMDAPTSGALRLLGKPVEALAERERTRFRREQIGFVFQHFGLLSTLTVAENILLPAFFAGRRRRCRCDQLIRRVGLEQRRDHYPHQLSGGEMQRVAIARALINEPCLLLADEPTGNLDSSSGASIIALFEELNREGLTILVVTHNPQMAEATSRQMELVDGRLLGTPAAIKELQSVRHYDTIETDRHSVL